MERKGRDLEGKRISYLDSKMGGIGFGGENWKDLIDTFC